MNPQEKLLLENIFRRIVAAVFYAEQGKKSKRLFVRSIYYRAAIMTICTAVEGLVYLIIKQQATDPDPVIATTVKKVFLCNLPELLSATALYAFQDGTEETRLSKNRSFQALNDFCKNKSYVTKAEYRQLESVRKIRKNFHVQTLSTPDHGYTEQAIGTVSRPLPTLLKKIIIPPLPTTPSTP